MGPALTISGKLYCSLEVDFYFYIKEEKDGRLIALDVPWQMTHQVNNLLDDRVSLHGWFYDPNIFMVRSIASYDDQPRSEA